MTILKYLLKRYSSMIEIEKIYNNLKGIYSKNFRILGDDFGIVILPKQSKD
jgi:hypothetical protein